MKKVSIHVEDIISAHKVPKLNCFAQGEQNFHLLYTSKLQQCELLHHLLQATYITRQFTSSLVVSKLIVTRWNASTFIVSKLSLGDLLCHMLWISGYQQSEYLCHLLQTSLLPRSKFLNHLIVVYKHASPNQKLSDKDIDIIFSYRFLAALKESRIISVISLEFAVQVIHGCDQWAWSPKQ